MIDIGKHEYKMPQKLSSTLTYSVANFISPFFPKWKKKNQLYNNELQNVVFGLEKLIIVGNTDLSNLKNRPTSLSNFLQGS